MDEGHRTDGRRFTPALVKGSSHGLSSGLVGELECQSASTIARHPGLALNLADSQPILAGLLLRPAGDAWVAALATARGPRPIAANALRLGNAVRQWCVG